MKELNEEILRKCAKGLMFDMTDEQYDLIFKEFDVTLEQLKLINEIDLKDINKGGIVYLDDSGCKWEGDSLNGKAFGYGFIYNSINRHSISWDRG